MRSVVRVHLSPLARAFELNKNPNGGVAQLGEHLPCKQGVKSSNLFISIGLKKLNQREFFENYTVKENGSFSEIKQKKSRVFCI